MSRSRIAKVLYVHVCGECSYCVQYCMCIALHLPDVADFHFRYFSWVLVQEIARSADEVAEGKQEIGSNGFCY